MLARLAAALQKKSRFDAQSLVEVCSPSGATGIRFRLGLGFDGGGFLGSGGVFSLIPALGPTCRFRYFHVVSYQIIPRYPVWMKNLTVFSLPQDQAPLLAIDSVCCLTQGESNLRGVPFPRTDSPGRALRELGRERAKYLASETEVGFSASQKPRPQSRQLREKAPMTSVSASMGIKS
jgi:hypothetical protein